MKGILGKFWLAITSLVLIILIIIWFFQIVFLNHFYIKEREELISEEAKELSTMIAEAQGDSIRSQMVLEKIDSIISSYDARVLIMDVQNNTLFYSVERMQPMMQRGHHHMNQWGTRSYILRDPEIREKIDLSKSFTIIRRSAENHEPSIFVGAPVINEGKKIAHVIITSPIASIEETISILKKQLTTISILSLAIGTFLALFLARFFTKPILGITNVAKQISKGDFSAKVDHRSNDEIGILSDTINDMAGQLNKIEQLRRDFIANITHELKTPLSLIKAYAELLEDTDSSDDRKGYLEVITDESNRLNDMIEDILYLSKMEAGYLDLQWEDFCLNEIIDNVVEKLSFFASNKNVVLDVVGLNEELEAKGDKSKLYQVFYNIINNAIQHSLDNQRIVIKILEKESVIRAEIIDQGKGIPKEDLPHIWDRFYKVDKSRKRCGSGTGLGMSIVKNILEAHKFNYGIESQEGMGTTVWFEMKK